MSFTELEKTRIRYHLGYLNVSAVSTFQFGVPANVQTQFMIEAAMDKVLPEAEVLARDLVSRLDTIDLQLFENTENLVARRVDEIELNQDEFKMVVERYKYFQHSLANLLAVPPNPFDMRFSNILGNNSINVRVSG